jgi:hypothetical protein
VIRKPEDLSECCADASWTEAIGKKSEDKKRDIPGLIFSIRGFFLVERYQNKEKEHWRNQIGRL